MFLYRFHLHDWYRRIANLITILLSCTFGCCFTFAAVSRCSDSGVPPTGEQTHAKWGQEKLMAVANKMLQQLIVLLWDRGATGAWSKYDAMRKLTIATAIVFFVVWVTVIE